MEDYEWDDKADSMDFGTPESSPIDSTPESAPTKSSGSDITDKYPGLFLMAGKQRFYTPFLFYLIMIVFMGMLVFNYSVD